MEKKIIVLVLAVIFIALLGCAYVLYDKLSDNMNSNQLLVQTQSTQAATDDNPEQTDATIPLAPDFVVYDIKNNEVRLSDYFGKPIVVNFWASWCGPCKMEMPDFYEKYLEMGEDVHFLMINMTDGSRETVDIAAKFIQV